MFTKVRRYCFLLSLSLCNIVAQAQFVYFDSLYDSGLNINEGISSEAIIEYQPEIYSVMSYSTNPFTTGQLFYFETAVDGHRIKEFLIENEIPGRHYSKDLIILSDSIAITASSFTDTTDQQLQCLTKFNRQTGELIMRNYYGISPHINFCAGFIKTLDGGYALIGQSQDSIGSDAQIHLLKTDSSGNQEWENLYGGDFFESIYSIIQTNDTGYLLLGYTQSFGTGYRDFYLVKTDSEGNQQWQKTYGSSVGNDVGRGIVPLQDGNFLLTSYLGDANDNAIAVIKKINPTGVVIWSKNYSYPNHPVNNLFMAKELSDKSIIAVGGTYDNNEAGYLVKTDSAGNLIWQRKYNKNDNTDLFYSVLPTSDGGYLLGGQARNDPFANQDAWLLKVDDLGCPYANCTVGIDENDNTKVVADIWPNPANEVLNIEFQNEDDWQITLIDLNGKVVYETTDHGRRTTVNVSTLSNGVYLLQLVSDGSVVNKKIVVQH